MTQELDDAEARFENAKAALFAGGSAQESLENGVSRLPQEG